MTIAHARSITTNQTSLHDDLLQTVAKHKKGGYKRPIAQHTKLAFENLLAWLGEWDGEVILDACCGVGESTINIASQYPHAKVIGVDKSVARLNKHTSYAAGHSKNQSATCANNYLLVQADLNDFWRLLVGYVEEKAPKWTVVKQFILYPNPYPKKTHLGKRWHGSALFPFIVALCPAIEVRSNWQVYLEEFSLAAQFYGLKCSLHRIEVSTGDDAYTPFERKYFESGQTCCKLVIRPSGSDK